MQNQQHHHQNQKPEYVLKRANDLINSSTGGTGEEKRWALELLHNFIGSKKKVVQWNKTYEFIMKRHVELCIDLKNHHFAKDGLHQYRNLCQTMDPASLEVVILHLLDLTEAQTVAARGKVLEGAAFITDLDQEESPESIMLSTMTQEGDKERSSREVVVPWLKFLWETYRAVLELLSRIPKLEKVYHKTCEKAFKFCQEYDRKLEFKRLCDLLHAQMQLATTQKASSTSSSRGRYWDLTPESVDLHLSTRFLQLETATSLELWNEGFRIVEDIYSIMTIGGRKNARSKIMSVYYEKLTRIFWVSENYLFHAYAWFRYYCLVSEFKKDFKPEERTVLASCVLLSALSVPSLRDAESVNNNNNSNLLSNGVFQVEEDDVATEKQQQIATLLDFQANPTRKALLNDIVNKGILAEVMPELANLYDDLEVKFQPLTLSKNIISAISHIKSVAQLAIYAVPLQKVAVFKVVQQLSKVYDVVKISFLRKILEGLEDISPNSVERLMIDGVIRKQLQLRIDHVAQCVRFGASVVNESVIVETQVQVFGSKLQEVSQLVAGITKTSESEAAKVAARREFLAKVLAMSEKDHALALERKNIIEQRKAEVDRVQEERERISQMIQEAEAARLAAEEEYRLEQERLRREAEKAAAQAEKEECKIIRRELEKYGQQVDEAALMAMPVDKRRGLVSQAKADALRAKEEQERKLTDQAKKLDHITRALRIESAEVLRTRSAAQLVEAEAKHRENLASFLANSRAQHDKELIEKARWQPLQIHKAFFDNVIIKAQRKVYDAEVSILTEKALSDYRASKVARARQLWDEEWQRLQEEEELARERREKEERDRFEREQYELLRKQREEAEEVERIALREKEEKSRALEMARQQKLAEAKRLQQQAQAPAPAPVPAAAPESSSGWSRGGASRSSGFERGSSGFERGGERSGGFERGGERSGGFERGGERPGGFERGGERSGGFERGGERPGGFERGGERSGGFERGGERSGGFERGGDKPKEASSWSRGGAGSGPAAAEGDRWGSKKPTADSGDKWGRNKK